MPLFVMTPTIGAVWRMSLPVYPPAVVGPLMEQVRNSASASLFVVSTPWYEPVDPASVGAASLLLV